MTKPTALRAIGHSAKMERHGGWWSWSFLCCSPCLLHRRTTSSLPQLALLCVLLLGVHSLPPSFASADVQDLDSLVVHPAVDSLSPVARRTVREFVEGDTALGPGRAASRWLRSVGESPHRGHKSHDVRVYVFNSFSRQALLSVSIWPRGNASRQNTVVSDIPYGSSRLVEIKALSVHDTIHARVYRRRKKSKTEVKEIAAVERVVGEVYSRLPRALDCLLIMERPQFQNASITPIIVDRERGIQSRHAFLYFYNSLETPIARNLDVLAFSPAQCQINKYCIVRVARNMSNHQGIHFDIPVGEHYQDYEFKVVKHNSVLTLTDFKNVRSLLHERVALRLRANSRNFLILDGLPWRGQSVRPYMMAYPQFTLEAQAQYEPTQVVVFNSYPSSLAMEVEVRQRYNSRLATDHSELVPYGQSKAFTRVMTRHEVLHMKLHNDGSSAATFRINQDIPYSQGKCLWVVQSEPDGHPGSFLACYPSGVGSKVVDGLSLVIIQHSLLSAAANLNVAFQEVSPIKRKRVYYLLTKRLLPGSGMRSFVQPGYYKVKVVPIDISEAHQHRINSMVGETCVHVESDTIYFGVVHGKRDPQDRFPSRFTLVRSDGVAANVNMSHCQPGEHGEVGPPRPPVPHPSAGNSVDDQEKERSVSSRPNPHFSLLLCLLCVAVLRQACL